MNTAELGQLAVLHKLTSLGARNIVVQKEGNKSFILFEAPNGKTCKVTTRLKKAGTWQTTTNYAAQCTLDKKIMRFGCLLISDESRILSILLRCRGSGMIFMRLIWRIWISMVGTVRRMMSRRIILFR